ncbi:hypothetical protein [Ruminococcus sp.]|uniref:hypothetical protein n=1 Tax=Ruminococcus sp. TaxID=41978 RepID=UPI001B5EE2C2|nr:hypothetical protein [Ruminococcus sp.]MBP5432695.1 hypothetical protein [Ruminococcus sp.]
MELARSKKYIIKNEWEIAYLFDAKTGQQIAEIAKFFEGDPGDAKISDDEKYCVVVGWGAIIYKLQPPFTDYLPGLKPVQWQKYLVDGDIWFEEIKEINSRYVTLISENGEEYRINVYI